MANIKSVSVKIGADTRDFINGLKQADKEITSTTKLANELEKGLKLEYNEKNFVQAQKQMPNALQLTADKAQQIRDRMKSLEESGRVNTADYEKLELELAKTENTATKLEAKLKEIDKIKVENATKGFTDLSKKLETTAKNMTAVSAAAGGLLVGMTKLAKDAVATGDEIATNADKYNLSAEAIQRWNYIALQSDVASETLYKSMVKVRDAIGTKLAGQTNSATNALESLGLSIENIGTDEQAFTQIVGALSNIEDSTTQAYLASEVFGEKIATDLIPLLKQGGDALNGYAQEFEQVGYLSNEQVADLAKFDNAMNKVNQQFQNSKTQLGTALLPVYQTLANLLEQKIIPAIQKVTNWFSNLSDSMKQVATGALMLATALAPVLLGASKIVGLIPAISKGLSALSAHPIIAIIGVVAGLVAYLYSTNEQFRKSVNNLVSVLSRALGAVFAPIANILSIILKLVQPLIDLLGNQLAFSLSVVAKMLEPIVWFLEKISQLANAVGNFIGKLFGWSGSDIKVDATTMTNTAQPTMPNFNDFNFDLPTTGSNTTNYDYSSDNYNIEITMNSTGSLDYDARTLADEVIKQIAVRKQALGR